MKAYIFIIALLSTFICFGQTKYEKDFNTFWNDEKEYQTQRRWVEYVKPRKTPFTGKVYIAVG